MKARRQAEILSIIPEYDIMYQWHQSTTYYHHHEDT